MKKLLDVMSSIEKELKYIKHSTSQNGFPTAVYVDWSRGIRDELKAIKRVLWVIVTILTSVGAYHLFK